MNTIEPRRVLGSAAPWPLHGAESTRAIETRAMAITPPHALMARAGHAVARLAIALMPLAGRILVLAGPGNNGGDGLIAAMHLHRLGRRVVVIHLADPSRLPADAADALARARTAGVELRGSVDDLPGCNLVIDALLGIGGSRAPSGSIRSAIDAIGRQPAPVLAVDLPTGLDGRTGSRLGDAAVKADWTLSLLTLKPGLFTAEGRDHAGEVWHDSLGVTADEQPCAWLGSAVAPPPPGLPARLHTQHKGSFGDVLVVGGAPGMRGAAWLASRAALVAGAGRVYVSLLGPGEAEAPLPELMQRPRAWESDPASLETATVVCGCGGAALVADVLAPLLEHAGRLVLDADALNAVAAQPGLQQRLVARSSLRRPTVLTPHPLEAARLLQTTSADVQFDRLAAASRLAERYRAVIVLKGSGTVVADGCGPPWINASGNAALAAPGSGDVLAGWLGGLWARHGAAAGRHRAGGAMPIGTGAMPASEPLERPNPWTGDETIGTAVQAARSAVWLHGLAADRSHGRGLAPGHLPLLAGALIDRMEEALR